MLYFAQVFKVGCVFNKVNYTAENRKKALDIRNTIESNTGYYQDNILYLPQEMSKSIESQNVQLIIKVDLVSCSTEFDLMNHTGIPERNIMIYGTTNQKSFDIFNVKQKDDANFEIFLNYDKNAVSIGIPKRDNHKISEIKPGAPFRYLINGKSDFSMTGRKQRTYYEYEYIFEGLRPVNRIEYLDEKELLVLKKIERKNCKIIDERKMLR